MPGNPVSIQHQRYSRVLSKSSLQRSRPYRASSWQAQTIQAHRAAVREDSAELWLLRRARLRIHLDQIRPHGLGFGSISNPTKPVEAHDRQILVKRRAFIRAVFICSCTIADLYL